MSLRKAIHQFFLHVANLFYEEEKEVLVMGELTKKLRYQKTNGVTGAITLYSTAAEAGDNHLNLQVDNVNAYAALGEVSDANASHLRIQKGGTTYAILKELSSYKFRGTYTNVPTNNYQHDEDYLDSPTAFVQTPIGNLFFSWIANWGGGNGNEEAAADDYILGYTLEVTYPFASGNYDDVEDPEIEDIYTNYEDHIGCTHPNKKRVTGTDEDGDYAYWECPLVPPKECESSWFSSHSGYSYTKCDYYDNTFKTQNAFWSSAPAQITVSWGRGDVVLTKDAANKKYTSGYLPIKTGEEPINPNLILTDETGDQYLFPYITISY